MILRRHGRMEKIIELGPGNVGNRDRFMLLDPDQGLCEARDGETKFGQPIMQMLSVKQ